MRGTCQGWHVCAFARALRAVADREVGVKFKLDENLGAEIARILREFGHDVSTVPEQKLYGATDDTIYGVCRRE